MHPELHQNLTQLLLSGQKENITLAIEIATGLHMSKEELFAPWAAVIE